MFILLLLFFLVSAAAFFSGRIIIKNEKKDNSLRYLAFFWFFTAVTWLIAGFAATVWRLGFFSIYHDFLVYPSYITPIVSIPFLIYFLIEKLTGKLKLARNFFIVFMIFSAAFIIILLTTDSLNYPPKVDEWNIKAGLKGYALMIFYITSIVAVFFVFIDLFRRIMKWFISGRIVEKNFFFSSVSLLIYAIVGSLEGGGFLLGWRLMLSRIFMVVAIFLAYLAYSGFLKAEDKKREIEI